MFGIIPWTLFLFSASSSDNPFTHYRLAGGYERVEEATLLAAESGDADGSRANYANAIALYREGISMARTTVISLQEEGSADGEDDPEEALSWLIDAYRKSSAAQLAHGNLDGARSDAWASCVFSQNTDMESLTCMLNVCQAAEDAFGEYSTTKQILNLYDDRKDLAISKEEREKLVQRIGELEEHLKNKSSSSD